MLREIVKSFFYLLLLNNFLFRYFFGAELPTVMENSPKKIFRFSVFTSIIFILTSLIFSYSNLLLIRPFNLETFSLLISSLITMVLVFVFSLFFKELSAQKRYLILNVIFLSTIIYNVDLSLLSMIIFGILNGVFIFVSFIVLSNLYDRIKTKSEKLNPDFVYYITISVISMLMFGFTGLKI